MKSRAERLRPGSELSWTSGSTCQVPRGAGASHGSLSRALYFTSCDVAGTRDSWPAPWAGVRQNHIPSESESRKGWAAAVPQVTRGEGSSRCSPRGDSELPLCPCLLDSFSLESLSDSPDSVVPTAWMTTKPAVQGWPAPATLAVIRDQETAMGVWEMLALGQHDAAADGAARGGTVQPWRVGFPLSTGTVTQVPISLCLGTQRV